MIDLSRRGFLASAAALAAAPAHGVGAAETRSQAVADRVSAIFYSQSLPGRTSANSQVRHRLGPAGVSDLRLVYGNWSLSASGSVGEQDGPAPRRLAASILHEGKLYPVTFGGARVTELAPGAEAASDPVAGLRLPPGALFFSRTWYEAPDSMFFRSLPVWAGLGEWNAIATGPDLTLSDAVPKPGSGLGYGPLAVLGRPDRPVPAVAILGDSIANGHNGGDGAADTEAPGFIARALMGHGGFIRLTVPQGTLFSATVHTERSHRLIRDRVSHAICQYGINDLAGGRSAAEMKQRYLALWGGLAEMGIKVFQTTITPRTESRDNWTSAEGQTAARTLGPGSTRTEINDWIRTVPAPLAGYFEAADLVESARNSGLWKSDGTPGRYVAGAGGVHPTPFGHEALSRAIDLGKLR